MISATSRSSGASLFALFGKPQSQTASSAATAAAARKPPPGPPPGPPPSSGGMGMSAESLISSLLGALAEGDGTTSASTDAATAFAPDETTGSAGDDLSALLTRLMAAMDTDGDGAVSGAEIRSAVESLQTAEAGGGRGGVPPGGPHGPPPGPSPEGAQTSASGRIPAKSLYESLFDAITSEDAAVGMVSISNDLAQTRLTAQQIAA